MGLVVTVRRLFQLPLRPMFLFKSCVVVRFHSNTILLSWMKTRNRNFFEEFLSHSSSQFFFSFEYQFGPKRNQYIIFYQYRFSSLRQNLQINNFLWLFWAVHQKNSGYKINISIHVGSKVGEIFRGWGIEIKWNFIKNSESRKLMVFTIIDY